MKRRRLRGLVLTPPADTRRHTPGDLSDGSASWGERLRSMASVAGAASTPPPYTSPGTTTALLPTASHQDRSHSASRSRCARAAEDPAAELDHRLAINVARAMGPEALRRAFTLENLHWLCSSCHRRKTRLDRRLARFLSDCSLDWRGARRAWRINRAWAGVFLAPLGIVDAGRHAETLEDVRTAA